MSHDRQIISYRDKSSYRGFRLSKTAEAILDSTVELGTSGGR